MPVIRQTGIKERKRMPKDVFAAARKPKPQPEPMLQLPATVQQPPEPVPEPRWPKNRTRVGKMFFGGYIDPAAHDILRKLAYQERREMQALLKEALNLLFESRGEPPIA
jgi:hypothetical protein